jgi:S1-C subfamily serine protease
VIEPIGPGSQPPEPAPSAGSAPASTWRRSTAVVLLAAFVAAAVGTAAALVVLRFQGRTNPQEVNLGSRVTITEESAIVQVAAKAQPAVVTVLTRPSGDDGAGSGFFVTRDGYLVTVSEVVAGAADLAVVVPGDPRRHPARLVDADCRMGLAVLKVDGLANLPTLSVGDSAALRAGQTVVALAGPIALRDNVSRGIVTSLHAAVTMPPMTPQGNPHQYADTIQTDARLNSQNAGGPLLNVGGQVVGVPLASRGGTSGTALAASDLQPEVEQVVQGGRLAVPALGIQWTDVDLRAAALEGLPQGALVTGVSGGGPADGAGLQPGDVVTQLDELKVDAAHPLGALLRTRFRPAQRVAVTASRQGSSRQVQLTLAEEQPSCS